MTVLFHTLGCKVNQYETQAMRRLMENDGWRTAEYTDAPAQLGEPLVIVINSCTVTGESDRKLRQLLRRCRREHAQAVLVLTGCMPQAFPEVAESFTEADIVLGNAARRELPRYIREFLTMHQRLVDIQPHGAAFESLAIDDFQEHTRAFVKIEDGCNRFCSYCIIPYARGRVRSKPLEELQSELEALAGKGYREIVLVGINLTAYGQEWGKSLCDAVEVACGVEGIDRVRLGSLEPDMMTDEVIDRLTAQPKLCPQFHLALQSGCGATLRRMNRHYTPDQYCRVCDELRRHFPECALTTDIMVGFPGEDEDEFTQSLEFVRDIGFSRVHVFAYSPRPGTPAATAKPQVSNEEKTRRSRRMIQTCDALRDAYADRWVGRCVPVLLETRCKDGCMEGYTPEYLQVRVPLSGGEQAGQTLTVRITGHSDGVCTGEKV